MNILMNHFKPYLIMVIGQCQRQNHHPRVQHQNLNQKKKEEDDDDNENRKDKNVDRKIHN